MDAQPCRLILLGMMGSGKTTVGRLLADASGWPYHDNDALLSQLTGLTARELLARDGEAKLRAAEVAALLTGLGRPAPCIVGAAAGTIMSTDVRPALRAAGYVVWLRARPETLAVRAAGGWHRPWLADDPVEWLAARAAEREPLYRQTAHLIIDVDTMRPPQIADSIRAHVRAQTGCPT